MARTPVAAVAILTAAPSLYAAARGHHDLSFPVTMASVVGAASVAFAVDDPAEPTLTPCPVPRSTRRWTRAALISLAVVASWAIVVVSAHAADYSLNPLRPRIAETAAAAAFAIAFAARAGRDGSDSPGLAAVTATLLTFGVSSGLALSITWLPQLGHPQHATRWWIVASAAATAAWWWSRDPSARIRLLESTPGHPFPLTYTSVQEETSTDSSAAKQKDNGHDPFTENRCGDHRRSVDGRPARTERGNRTRPTPSTGERSHER